MDVLNGRIYEIKFLLGGGMTSNTADVFVDEIRKKHLCSHDDFDDHSCRVPWSTLVTSASEGAMSTVESEKSPESHSWLVTIYIEGDRATTRVVEAGVKDDLANLSVDGTQSTSVSIREVAADDEDYSAIRSLLNR